MRATSQQKLDFETQQDAKAGANDSSTSPDDRTAPHRGVEPAHCLPTQTGLQSSPANRVWTGRTAEGRLRIPERHWPTGDAITVELMA